MIKNRWTGYTFFFIRCFLKMPLYIRLCSLLWDFVVTSWRYEILARTDFLLAWNLRKSEKISKDNSVHRTTLTRKLKSLQSHNLWSMANTDAIVIRGFSSETSADEAGKRFFLKMIRIEAGLAIVLMDAWVRQINKAVYMATSDVCGWTGGSDRSLQASKQQNTQ